MKSKNTKKKNDIVKKPEEAKTVRPPKLESTPVKSWIDELGNPRTVVDPKLASKGLQKYVTGTKDTEIAENILTAGSFAIESALALGKSSAEKSIASLNIMAQSLHDFQPKDAMEARLVAQIAALFQHGMDRLGKAGRSDYTPLAESQVNMAIKLLRVHIETIESLNRYRRGGEQKFTVTHAILAGNAIVNNFGGVGIPPENRGDTPCSEDYVEQKQEPTTISHVVSPQWPIEKDAGCTAEKVLVRNRKKAKSG